jgi:hypothetical protein
MKKDDDIDWSMQVEDYYWYKFMALDPIVLNDALDDYDIDIERNDIIGVYAGKSGFKAVFSTDPDIEFPMSEADAKVLIENSRPYKGKVEGKKVEGGFPWEIMLGKTQRVAKVNDLPSKREPAPQTNIKTVETIPVLYRPVSSRPKPKQIPLELQSIKKEVALMSNVKIYPLDTRMKDLLEEASKYLGLMKKISARTLRISMSEETSTSLITSMRGRTMRDIYINIQPSQLAQINKGKFDASILAQAITHELGHYIWNQNIVRTSDQMKFKKQIAGLRFHPDQYNHKQGYPWYEEHWAMLCEYLVHGRSARNLQNKAGAEIAAQYFYNEYMEL